MKPIKSSRGLYAALEKATSGVAGDTIVSAKAVCYIAELLEKMVRAKQPEKYPHYRLFMAYQIKIEGKSFDEAVELWNERKEAIKNGSE